MSIRKSERILVTGSAGFIGSHLVKNLVSRGYSVLGIDNMSAYYDVSLKKARLERLMRLSRYSHVYCDIANKDRLLKVFEDFVPSTIVHLAAQPGVRNSITDPDEYVNTNVTGTFHILEACRRFSVDHLLMASSSAVYGASIDLPYREDQHTSCPVSLYGATKKAAEVMAHSYSHLYGLPITALRFFTVFGPWGRPDMAPMLFASALTEGREISLFNEGRNLRSFTYVDDVIESVLELLHLRPKNSPATCAGNQLVDANVGAPFRILNIGGRESISTIRFVRLLEKSMRRKARLRLLPAQPGDMAATESDCSLLESITGDVPGTAITAGVNKFVAWFSDYHAVASSRDACTEKRASADA